ncbi:MAG: hypothetical protein RI894_1803 [Bacteroidota bacterium]
MLFSTILLHGKHAFILGAFIKRKDTKKVVKWTKLYSFLFLMNV